MIQRLLLFVVAAFSIPQQPVQDAVIHKDWSDLPALVERLGSPHELTRSTAISELEHRLTQFLDQPLWWSHDRTVRPDYIQHITPLVPRLAILLSSDDHSVATTSLGLLRLAGDAARSAGPAVAALANGCPDEGVRYGAFGTLCFITPESQSVIDQIDLCKVYSLSMYPVCDPGNPVQDAVPQIPLGGLDLLAVGVFQDLHLSGHTRVEIPAITKIIETGSSRQTRLFGILVMADMGHEADDAISVLRKTISSENFPVSHAAASVLLEIEGTQECVDFILANLKLNESDRRQFETDAQERLAEKIAEAKLERESNLELINGDISAFRQYFHSMLGHQQRGFLRTMIEVGTEAAELIPDVQPLLNHHDSETRRLAAATLKSLNRK